MSRVYVVLKKFLGIDSYRVVTTECGPPSFDRSKLWPSISMFSHRSWAKLGKGASKSGSKNAPACDGCIGTDVGGRGSGAGDEDMVALQAKEAKKTKVLLCKETGVLEQTKDKQSASAAQWSADVGLYGSFRWCGRHGRDQLPHMAVAPSAALTKLVSRDPSTLDRRASSSHQSFHLSYRNGELRKWYG